MRGRHNLAQVDTTPEFMGTCGGTFVVGLSRALLVLQQMTGSAVTATAAISRAGKYDPRFQSCSPFKWRSQQLGLHMLAY